MKTVIVIGGGASGLVAALSAAADKQNRVLLFERGNGRCNLTNTAASPAHYHGEDPAFVTEALARFTPDDTLAFFRSLGLLTVEEYGGRVYPLSDSANSVLDVLRFAVERAGVEVLREGAFFLRRADRRLRRRGGREARRREGRL